MWSLLTPPNKVALFKFIGLIFHDELVLLLLVRVLGKFDCALIYLWRKILWPESHAGYQPITQAGIMPSTWIAIGERGNNYLHLTYQIASEGILVVIPHRSVRTDKLCGMKTRTKCMVALNNHGQKFLSNGTPEENLIVWVVNKRTVNLPKTVIQ